MIFSLVSDNWKFLVAKQTELNWIQIKMIIHSNECNKSCRILQKKFEFHKQNEIFLRICYDLSYQFQSKQYNIKRWNDAVLSQNMKFPKNKFPWNGVCCARVCIKKVTDWRLAYLFVMTIWIGQTSRVNDYRRIVSFLSVSQKFWQPLKSSFLMKKKMTKPVI